MIDHSAFAKYIRAYCFGQANPSERDAVEIHLLECDYCWQEVQRLEASIRVLESQRDLIRSLSPQDFAATFGISGRLPLLLGGHVWHVWLSSFLYASLFVVTLVMEIAYLFDEYGGPILRIAPIVFILMFTTSFVGLAVSWKMPGTWKGLIISISTFLISAGILHGIASLILPSFSITLLNGQAHTAQSAYLKDTYYALILALLFLAVPFHFVVTMQRKLRDGRYRYALEVLTDYKLGIEPKGSIHLKLWVLGLALMFMISYSAYATSNLISHISPGPYMNLFMNLIYLRIILYYGLALECLIWYYRALNDLKRECRVAVSTRLEE